MSHSQLFTDVLTHTLITEPFNPLCVEQCFRLHSWSKRKGCHTWKICPSICYLVSVTKVIGSRDILIIKKILIKSVYCHRVHHLQSCYVVLILGSESRGEVCLVIVMAGCGLDCRGLVSVFTIVTRLVSGTCLIYLVGTGSSFCEGKLAGGIKLTTYLRRMQLCLIHLHCMVLN